MTTLAVFLVLGLSLPLRAQEEQQAPQENYAEPAPAYTEEPTGNSDMSLDDARMNFGTVIDAFVSQRTRNGFWPLKDKATGKLRHLVVVSKDPKSVKPAGDGAGRFWARATLRDELTNEKLKADFLVDFSGAEWKVKGMRIIPPPKPKKKKEAPPAAAQPAAPPAADQPPMVPVVPAAPPAGSPPAPIQ